jgi:ankyrin repeat protein
MFLKIFKKSSATLFDAVKTNDAHAVRNTLRYRVPVNPAEPDGWTPLHWAALLANLEITTMLIKAGADMQRRCNLGRTPLHWAAIRGHHELVQNFIQAGADINVMCRDGNTPLMLAQAGRHMAIVGSLLNAKANIHIKNNAGESAVTWARKLTRYE